MKKTDNLTVKKRVLKLCENAIRKDLGNLNDLPYDLSNTIANIYYSFFEFACRTLKYEQIVNLPIKTIKEALMLCAHELESRGNEVSKVFNARLISVTAAIESVPEFIEVLREIDKEKERMNYELCANFIIDYLKYNIKDVKNKRVIKRLIERKIKERKGEIHEIPDLVKEMNLI